MMQFAIGISAAKEAVGLLTTLIESPETYDRLEGLRQFLCKLTGKEIAKSSVVALFEDATQGAPYTGAWEEIKPTENDKSIGCASRRLRVDGGWIYDPGRSNVVFVPDPK